MPGSRQARAAFTLIEMLVVMGIMALLIGLLAPALSNARGSARSVVCQSNLRNLMEGVFIYAAGASDMIVPSYNMTGVSASVRNPLDGWGPILDRSQIVPGSRELSGNPFCCPNTLDRAGVASTQTGSDPANPQGYMDWPAVVTVSQTYATTIPTWGFDRIIRVGYWINGDNPLGVPRAIKQGLHFTGSVGYGPDPGGQVLKPCVFSRIRKPSQLIAFSDGLYAGKQEATRPGERDSRIGYRHARGGEANLAFADGHVGSIQGHDFPRRLHDGMTLEQARRENIGERPTVYADPEGELRR